jgi:hypothetical protein
MAPLRTKLWPVAKDECRGADRSRRSVARPRERPGRWPLLLAGLGLVAVGLAAGCAAGDAGASGSAGASGIAGVHGGAGTGGAGAGGSAAGGSAAGGSAAGGSAAGGSAAGGSTGCAPATARIAWTIGYGATTPALTCDQAAANRVELFMDSVRFPFTCGDNSGVTTVLVAGPYNPRILLVGTQGTVLTQGGLPAVTIPTCGATNLGNVRFVITPTGAGGSGGAGGTSGAAGTGGGAGSSGAAGTSGTGPCDAMPIFVQHNCTVDMACHDAKGSAAGFDMKTAGWEKLLVGRPPRAGGAPGLPSQCIASGLPYLVAGSVPARGLFLDKLGPNTQPCGARMPLVPSFLNATELDCVQRWANVLTKK